MVWGDYLSFEYGKPVKDKQSIDGNVPVFGTNGQIGTSHLPPLCKIPSFVVGRKGAYRGVHYSSVPFSVIDTAFYALPLTDKVDLKWAYYKFLTYDINRMDSGSAIPSTDRYELYKIEVEIPSLETQKKIVSVLDVFENIIRVNSEINENLYFSKRGLCFGNGFRLHRLVCTNYQILLTSIQRHTRQRKTGALSTILTLATLHRGRLMKFST